MFCQKGGSPHHRAIHPRGNERLRGKKGRWRGEEKRGKGEAEVEGKVGGGGERERMERR